MADSADVKSIEALQYFQASVLKFQENARTCVSALEMQLLKITGWLERDRPNFWKREIENCYREMGEARVRLHKCKMRRVGDFRPTCFEERKDLEKAKRDLEFAQKQIPVVKYWNVCASHEANEYHGRASQLTQMIERDIPQLLALMHHAIDRLETYNTVQVPGTAQSSLSDRKDPTEENSGTSSVVEDEARIASSSDMQASEEENESAEIEKETPQ